MIARPTKADNATLVERLRERSSSYMMGGPSSSHTSALLDEAAARIAELEATLISVQRYATDMVLAEREACAKELTKMQQSGEYEYCRHALNDAAIAIRARPAP